MQNLQIDGRLCNAVEVKSTASGNEFVSFRFANNNYNTNTKQEETTFYDVAVFDTSLIPLAKTMKKGSYILINGELSLRLYNDRFGEQQIGRSIRARMLNYLSSGSKRDENATEAPAEPHPAIKEEKEPRAVAEAKAARKAAKPKAEPEPAPVIEEPADDLPF